MFRVRDGVKFGASRVCPMCNSGCWRPVDPAGVQTRDYVADVFMAAR